MTEKVIHRPVFQGDVRVVDPSDNTVSSEAQFAGAVERLVPLLALPDHLFDQLAPQYLEQRLRELRSPLEQVVDSAGGTNDFILETTVISPTNEGGQYRIDDESIYEHALPTMRRLYRQFVEGGGIEPERAFFSAAVHTAQIEQTRYFNGLPTKDRAKARSRILARATGEFGPLSIADLKDAPMCSERAAVAHNVLHLIGVPATFHAGVIGRATGNGSELVDKSAHAFLTVVNAQGEKRLFDLANPRKYKVSGSVVQETPSVYEMPNGGSDVVVAEKQNYDRQPNGSFAPGDTTTIVYGFRGLN